MDEKKRVIQEYVPGKQVTLAHLIANPNNEIYKKLGLIGDNSGAIGILTITPGEASIIAADIATKNADIKIGFLDRFSGTVVITGDVSSVQRSLESVISFLEETLKFSISKVTRS